MARVSPLQPSFNAGELSPWLAARTTFEKYPSGLETCLNGIGLPEGGFQRRSGTRFVAEVKDSTAKTRLKPFVFSTTQAYMVEMGNNYFRFFRHQGQIVVADTDAAITNGTFTSNITDWDDRSTGGAGNQISHDSTNGRLTLETSGTAADDIGWAEQDVTVGAGNKDNEHVIKFRVIGAPSDKIEFQVGTTSTGAEVIGPVEKEVGYHCVAFTPGATTFYVQFRNLGSFRDKDVQIDDVSLIDDAGVEVDTPYPTADLFEIEGPQSNDVLYLFHEDYATYKLLRLGHTTWSLVEVPWEDGPYLTQNTTATTLSPGAATGLGITITASATEGINGGDGFQSTDVGRSLRIDNATSGDAWGWGVIVAVNSTTSVDVDIRVDFSTASADSRWRLGAWSETTGFPRAGAFFEQRLVAGGSKDQPQTIWFSQSGAEFEDMTPDDRAATVEDDDALDFTISADDVNTILWFVPQNRLAIGTTGGEWTATSENAIITPTDITIRRQTKHGSARVQPVAVGDVVLFLQKAKRKIREFGFRFEVDGFRAFDMTRLARHISFGGFTEMTYQQEPNSLVLAARDDGQLCAMTFNREEDIVGWSRHILGGVFWGAITRVWRVDASAATFTEETTDAGDTGDADWTLFPASEAVGDYAAFGHTEPFTKLIFDYANGTAGVGGAVTWEYWDGDEWQALSGVTDGTTGFTAAAADGLTVTWTKPTDWEKRIVGAGNALYYVRARITTVYTTNPILDQGFVAGDAVVESVATIDGDDGSGQTQDSTDRNEVWVIVKRTINGATKRYVEVMERDFEDGHAQEDAYYADSIITYDSTATSTITGLDHLEGETVKIYADGAVHAEKTVSSGQVTLDADAAVVQVGLGYTHTLKTLKADFGARAGTAVGKPKSIAQIVFVLLNSHTLSFGPTTDSLVEFDFRVVSDPMDAAAPLFTGERKYGFEGGWDDDARIIVESDDPVPFTLLAIAPEMRVNERA